MGSGSGRRSRRFSTPVTQRFAAPAPVTPQLSPEHSPPPPASVELDPPAAKRDAAPAFGRAFGALSAGTALVQLVLDTFVAQLDMDDGTLALAVHRGDEAAGDTLRSCLAEVIVQTLANANTVDTDYTVLTVKGDAPSVDAIQDQLTASLA